MRRVFPCLVAGSIILACGAGTSGTDPNAAPCSGPGCTGPGGGPGGDVPRDDAGVPVTCTDGQKDGDESDRDCGGSCATKCAPGQACAGNGDCASLHCDGAACAAPTCTDGIKNQDETDVDCGGATCGKCAVGAACLTHGDCQSDGCDYNKKCALAPSCVAHHGGDTCGPGPDGDPKGVFESCCVALPVTVNGEKVNLDKYVITAGRMRAFVERYNGNMQKFIDDTNPPASAFWDPDWKQFLPSNLDEALDKLGPFADPGFTRQGCNVSGGGARTYWQPPVQGVPGEQQAYKQDVLDEKALQCVEFYTLAAFCLWDGGHLAHSDDLVAAWGPGPYPWGRDPAVSQNDTNTDDPVYDYVVHEFGAEFQGPYSYFWPEGEELDPTVHIAPPGRKPKGKGPFGHMDLAGLVFQMSSGFGTATDGSSQPIWLNSGSWEAHEIPSAGPALRFVSKDSLTRAYWAAGGRCAR